MSYLTFQDHGTSDSGKTKIWAILSAGSSDDNCLREIISFCESKTHRHKLSGGA